MHLIFRRLSSWLRDPFGRKEHRIAKGILAVGYIFSQPSFSYLLYQDAAKLLNVDIPNEIREVLKELDGIPWDKMTSNANLFIYQSSMELLPGLE